MGTIAYDFLTNSILFNEKSIETEYSNLTDSHLEILLNDYREHCLTNIIELTKEITDNKSSLKVLSSIQEIPFQTLKQSALYFDQFVIYDPLFPFTNKTSESSQVVSKYLGYKESGINRTKLTETIKLLKAITPMIAADFVKILPLSKAFEPPKEIPLNLPVNYYADSLPIEIMEYCREKVILQSTTQAENGGWKILDKQDFTPGIFVTFEGLEDFQGQIYNYFYQEYIKTNDPNKFNVKMKLAEYPVNKKEWEVWSNQCINQSSKEVVDKIYYENMIATSLNATYLTDNNFTSDLLVKNLKAKETIETSSATQFMNIELPFLDNININKLMDIRNYEADTFTNFRSELEKQFRELRTISDPIEIKIRQENIIHELGNVQVNKINQKFDSLKRKGLADGLLMLGGLAGTVQTAGWSLLASAIATVSSYKSYQEYKDNLKENPSYLLWKVLKK